MEVIGKSILKRRSRSKRITLKDGTEKDVKVTGGYSYRIRYIDDTGRTRTEERGTWSLKGETKRAMEAAIANLEKSSGHIRDGERMTFNDLIEICRRELYVGRESSSTKSILRTLGLFFGDRRLATIDRGAILAYIETRTTQTIRTAKGERRKRPVQRATVDKELRIMKSMINHALDEGWMLKNPFRKSKKLQPLIKKAAGTRDRVLLEAEEERLLAYCEPGKRIITYQRKMKGEVRTEQMEKATGNPWLKSIVLLGLDSGMRRGEILKMKWRDIDTESKVIHIPAPNTKTKQARNAPLSKRTIDELERVKKFKGRGDQVFPIKWISQRFNTAVRLAGISGLTFHDLRRTFTTRNIAGGRNLGMIAAATGHKDLKVLNDHYNKPGIIEMGQLATQIDAANQERIEGIQQAGDSNFVN